LGWDWLEKKWFVIALLFCIVLPIVLLVFLDYYNLEGFNNRLDPATNSFVHWNNKFLNQTFSFDVTWKGRMFYLIFAWFLILETAIGWQKIVDKRPTKQSLIAASLICALIPTIYVLATNFLGLDLAILKIGHSIGIPSVYSDNSPSDFLHLQWPISVEYMVFVIFFLSAVVLAYKARGLRIFSISFAFLGAMSVAYMLDTLFPFGVFRPLQELALPVSATAAALFDILGYSVMLTYPVSAGGSMIPGLTVGLGSKVTSVSVSWACSGIYSLLLYLLMMFIFFKRTNFSGFRKLLYFVIGLFGTFVVSVLRIYSIILINLQYGSNAGITFHNTYGELFGFIWIFAFIFLIVCIERFMLVERIKSLFKRTNYLKTEN
jgi:thaumarchaeosortase